MEKIPNRHVVGVSLAKLVQKPGTRLQWLQKPDAKKVLMRYAAKYQIASGIHLTPVLINDIMTELGLIDLDKYIDSKGKIVFDNVVAKIMSFFDYNMPKFVPFQLWMLDWLDEDWDGNTTMPEMGDSTPLEPVDRVVSSKSKRQQTTDLIETAAKLRGRENVEEDEPRSATEEETVLEPHADPTVKTIQKPTAPESLLARIYWLEKRLSETGAQENKANSKNKAVPKPKVKIPDQVKHIVATVEESDEEDTAATSESDVENASVQDDLFVSSDDADPSFPSTKAGRRAHERREQERHREQTAELIRETVEQVPTPSVPGKATGPGKASGNKIRSGGKKKAAAEPTRRSARLQKTVAKTDA